LGKPTGRPGKLERAAFPQYWPFPTSPCRRAVNQKRREFVVGLFGSPRATLFITESRELGENFDASGMGGPGANFVIFGSDRGLDADLAGVADRIPRLGFATMEGCLVASTPAPDPPLRMFLNPRSQSARAHWFQSPESAACPRIRGNSRDFRSAP
jgi:hypothetical protein